MKILKIKNIKKPKKIINVLRRLNDKKYFIFYKQIYEQKKFVFLIKSILKKFNFTIRKQLKLINNIIS